MSNQDTLALDILKSLGIAVLRRIAPKQYTVLGDPPPFYRALFPSPEKPWLHSAMLDFFIEDAEQFFDIATEGALTSGIWQEDGKTESDSALIATATFFGDSQVLIIRMLQEDYRERVGILRKAREQLLENRELTQDLATLREKSQFDGLTNVFNKSAFQELLFDEAKRSRILNYPLSLLILDIDNFKKVNDTYGHVVGDKVLQALGNTLKMGLRRNDVVARFGGEEFVVLVPHESLDQALRIGEKLRESIAAIRLDGVPPVTVSMGCATYMPGELVENLIARADKGLYTAKASGKNKVCVAGYPK